MCAIVRAPALQPLCICAHEFLAGAAVVGGGSCGPQDPAAGFRQAVGGKGRATRAGRRRLALPVPVQVQGGASFNNALEGVVWYCATLRHWCSTFDGHSCIVPTADGCYHMQETRGGNSHDDALSSVAADLQETNAKEASLAKRASTHHFMTPTGCAALLVAPLDPPC